jgi:Mrp family chromosome partitioning ATPase/capsular polysaccharide biosynthesis protein
LVVLLVMVAVLSAFALSAIQKQQYSATATFQLKDETEDLGLAGVAVTPTLTPAQLASQAAQSIVEPAVVDQVRTRVSPPMTSAELISAVTTSIDPNANLVHVKATGPTGANAALLANAFTAAVVNVANQTQRTAYKAEAAQLRTQAPPRSDVAATSVYDESLERLLDLAAIATPAQLTSTATVPTSPSSPRPLRNALIAGFLGLVLGLFVAYVWDAFDRRLRSADEIESAYGFSPVGRVRNAALGTTVAATDGTRHLDPLDWEQFRVLSRNLEFMGSSGPPRMIAVTSAMPEEGKTTVSTFIACAAAAAGKRTLLIECDLRRPALAERLGVDVSPGVVDFVRGDAGPADVLQVAAVHDFHSNDTLVNENGSSTLSGEQDIASPSLVCITAGSQTKQPVEVLESSAFQAMLAEVREAYDVVVLDTTPLLPVVDALEVIDRAELIVVCARTAKLTRDQARACKRALGRMPDRQLALVVTGIETSNSEYGYYGTYYAMDR